MTKINFILFLSFLTVSILFSSCEDFLNPKQDLVVTDEELYNDWYEYRSAEMGLYAVQQLLVEQIVVLGELRGDMMTITPNAEEDLVAIYNFNFPKDNKYVSPTNFFKLISASNNLLRVLQKNHPEVLDPNSPVTNYDRIYGEALCMRAWAYFSAVNIYGKVPYIPESLVTMDEIQSFVNSTGTYIDSVYIEYGLDGYHNADTIYNRQITLEKQLMDLDVVLDMFIDQLENDVKIVGVNHAINNNDYTWEVTTWNTWAWHALLGKMYKYQGNLAKAVEHFEKIIYNSTENYRYQLNGTYSRGNWQKIFTTIGETEHILTLWFNDEYYQNNGFQDLFESRAPHNYQLKPTVAAIQLWEGSNDQNRGLGKSYSYINEGNYNDQLSNSQVQEVKRLRQRQNYGGADAITEGYDTVIYKYSMNKNTFDEDANFILYRAAEIHLDLAEVYIYWAFEDGSDIRTYSQNALDILNNGANYSAIGGRVQLGVRGRVGLSAINTNHLPNGNLPGKQTYIDQRILEEKGRELAYEGKRFYDLVQIAKRQKNPSLLASKVAAKYPASMKNQIISYLMDENNWYIHYFD